MDGYLQRYRFWLDGTNIDHRGPLKRQVHQEEAVRWLITREESANRGGILADDMGLGKTYELMGLMVARLMPITLIVVPPALLEQWRQCLIKFVTGTRGLHVFHGRGAKVEPLPDVPVMLTTYMMVGKLVDKRDIEWGRIIFDEAHHLRNCNTRVYRDACRLRSPLKWGATGTPIQNRLSDLYSLCGVLSVPRDITRRGEYMLRRTKASVGLELPAVELTNVVIPWKTKHELEFAREIHELAPLVAPDGSNVDTIIRNLTSLNWNSLVVLLRARQVCINPHILVGVLDQLTEMGHEASLDDAAIEQLSCSKIDAVVSQVSEKNGSSKLVFCHFRAEIDILAERLRAEGLSVGIIDGRVSKRKRKEILARGDFLGEELVDEIFAPHLNRVKSHGTGWLHKSLNEYLGTLDVLIVQIQTGCEGLNLQQYQEVHFVSPHWNPAVEDQAIARCHRMGQMRPVRVFRYIMNNMGPVRSFEEYCKMVQDVKREIMQLIE